MLKSSVYVLSIMIMAFLLVSCIGGSSGEPPAAKMLPTLADHTTVEGQTITDYLSKVGGGAAMLAAQPQVVAGIAATDAVIGCYQEVGAVRARVYSNNANPLSVGAVAIADRNQLLNPINLFNCLPGQKGPQTTAEIEFCSDNYTLPKDENEFYILYAGTTTEMCQALCSQLEGCTKFK